MKFMAFDGKVFDTAAECEKYEKGYEAVDKDIFFLKITENGITKTIDPLHADYVVIKGEFDSDSIEALFDNFNCYCDGLDKGSGTYYWDNDGEKWEKVCYKIRELEREMNEIKDTIDRYTNLEKQIKIKFLIDYLEANNKL